MNDSMFSLEPSPRQDDPPAEETPRFGALDIVEAFTAMRHEWRGQTKESRALAEQIQQAVASLQALDKRSQSSSGKPAAPEAKPLALLLIETEHQLSRATAAIAQWEANQRLREESSARAVQTQIAALGALARWFARPLLALLAGQASAQPPPHAHPALEGLNMVLDRLRRMLREHEIERIDVLGQPFDAETMHAIGTAATNACPPGAVAEQVSPAYRWQGQLLRFATVRIAVESPQE